MLFDDLKMSGSKDFHVGDSAHVSTNNLDSPVTNLCFNSTMPTMALANAFCHTGGSFLLENVEDANKGAPTSMELITTLHAFKRFSLGSFQDKYAVLLLPGLKCPIPCLLERTGRFVLFKYPSQIQGNDTVKIQRHVYQASSFDLFEGAFEVVMKNIPDSLALAFLSNKDLILCVDETREILVQAQFVPLSNKNTPLRLHFFKETFEKALYIHCTEKEQVILVGILACKLGEFDGHVLHSTGGKDSSINAVTDPLLAHSHFNPDNGIQTVVDHPLWRNAATTFSLLLHVTNVFPGIECQRKDLTGTSFNLTDSFLRSIGVSPKEKLFERDHNVMCINCGEVHPFTFWPLMVDGECPILLSHPQSKKSLLNYFSYKRAGVHFQLMVPLGSGLEETEALTLFCNCGDLLGLTFPNSPVIFMNRQIARTKFAYYFTNPVKLRLIGRTGLLWLQQSISDNYQFFSLLENLRTVALAARLHVSFLELKTNLLGEISKDTAADCSTLLSLVNESITACCLADEISKLNENPLVGISEFCWVYASLNSPEMVKKVTNLKDVIIRDKFLDILRSMVKVKHPKLDKDVEQVCEMLLGIELIRPDDNSDPNLIRPALDVHFDFTLGGKLKAPWITQMDSERIRHLSNHFHTLLGSSINEAFLSSATKDWDEVQLKVGSMFWPGSFMKSSHKKVVW